MTVRLRAHHLLCMLTYVGKGYSPAFVDNYEAIAARLSAGEEIEIVDGPDDICAPLLSGAQPHCLGDGVAERDRKAAEAVAACLVMTVAAGTRVKPSGSLLLHLRRTFAEGDIRTACSGCEWSGLCDAVAADGYANARIAMAATDEAGHRQGHLQYRLSTRCQT
ncbi:DUF1284 domain-containing protein [Rhizobium sp. 18065]|uniref:DUF1284 domain-containing protein n=1 Tax=Rhizobium sp. 18065 TaxID=2681411 RepID=UPI00135A72C0|nr:DUF1284 domain-containing protein [Rhizobium sp. 18065]